MLYVEMNQKLKVVYENNEKRKQREGRLSSEDNQIDSTRINMEWQRRRQQVEVEYYHMNSKLKQAYFNH